MRASLRSPRHRGRVGRIDMRDAAGVVRFAIAMVYVLAVIAGIVAAAVGWFVTGAARGVDRRPLRHERLRRRARHVRRFSVVGPIGWADRHARRGLARVPYRGTDAPSLAPIGCSPPVVLAAIVDGSPPRRSGFASPPSTPTATPSRRRWSSRSAFRSACGPPMARRRASSCTPTRTSAQACSRGDWVDDAGGHAVIAGSVPLAFKTRSRLLVVSLPTSRRGCSDCRCRAIRPRRRRWASGATPTISIWRARRGRAGRRPTIRSRCAIASCAPTGEGGFAALVPR